MKCIEDKIPFELPEGWEWTRLELLTTLVTDYVANGSFATLKANVRTYKEKNYALFVRTVDFANNFEKDLSYIDKESYDFLDKSRLYGGELMLSNIGASIGKVFKIPYFDYPMSLAPNSIVLKFHFDTTSNFFEYVFKSFVGQEYLQRLTAGTAMPKFNKTELKQMLVPLPSLEEQDRIIAKIKEFFSIVDSIESDKIFLLTTIDQTKAKILDLAIRGKLVPQDPNDEPASVLLERIKAEKESLIRQGRIKRDKKESVIFKGEDNSYYGDMPDNWRLVSLSKITTSLLLNDGDWILSENMDDSFEVKLIQLGSIGFMKYYNKRYKSISNDTFNKLSCTQIHSKYLLINRIINDKMCSCILPEMKGKFITTVDTCWIAPDEKKYNLQFLMYALSSSIFQSLVLSNTSGTTRKRISKNNLIHLPLPYPPINEQKRIANKVSQLFSILDTISSSLD